MLLSNDATVVQARIFLPRMVYPLLDVLLAGLPGPKHVEVTDGVSMVYLRAPPYFAVISPEGADVWIAPGDSALSMSYMGVAAVKLGKVVRVRTSLGMNEDLVDYEIMLDKEPEAMMAPTELGSAEDEYRKMVERKVSAWRQDNKRGPTPLPEPFSPVTPKPQPKSIWDWLRDPAV